MNSLSCASGAYCILQLEPGVFSYTVPAQLGGFLASGAKFIRSVDTFEEARDAVRCLQLPFEAAWIDEQKAFGGGMLPFEPYTFRWEAA